MQISQIQRGQSVHISVPRVWRFLSSPAKRKHSDAQNETGVHDDPRPFDEGQQYVATVVFTG